MVLGLACCPAARVACEDGSSRRGASEGGKVGPSSASAGRVGLGGRVRSGSESASGTCDFERDSAPAPTSRSSGRGTVSGLPHAGHLPRLPASSSLTRSGLRQLGQSKEITAVLRNRASEE